MVRQTVISSIVLRNKDISKMFSGKRRYKYKYSTFSAWWSCLLWKDRYFQRPFLKVNINIISICHMPVTVFDGGNRIVWTRNRTKASNHGVPHMEVVIVEVPLWRRRIEGSRSSHKSRKHSVIVDFWLEQSLKDETFTEFTLIIGNLLFCWERTIVTVSLIGSNLCFALCGWINPP